MTTNVIIPPDLWDTDSEAVITTWFAQDGASVEKGTLLAKILTETIQHEIAAPASGTLKIIREVDDIVNKGACIGTIARRRQGFAR